MKVGDCRACLVCGTLLPVSARFCPVCRLRGALERESEPDEPASGSVEVESTPEPLAQRFDHYELLKDKHGAPVELGRGAMGVTYRALDTVLGRPVALKVIEARVAARPEARQRFLREARAAARLVHPHVASVFYYGVRKGDGQCFYAMELVEGESLEARLRRQGPLPVGMALEVVAQVARALGAADAQGLVHRDLKPANLMLSNGPGLTVKVIDFGLAKAAADLASEADLTQGGFVGTPAFASPEQCAAGSVDARSDLYSLGVTLWVMLAGKAPFGGSCAEVRQQHLSAPLPIEQLQGVPQPAVALLEVLLAKDPTQRFQSPSELLNAMPTVTRAMEAKCTIKPHELRMAFADRPSSRQKKSPTIRAPKQSIAVLPFDTLSQGKGDTYFADGVQDEILSNLAKVSQLKVISRTSVMTFRPGGNRYLRSIAESLGVASVVEGTVRRDGNRVRVTIRLVDARTDKALWSESYDRDLTDIFAIQSEIAQAVAAKLSARLSPEEKKRIEAKPTNSLEAYDLYLRANELFRNTRAADIIGNVGKSLHEAVTLLEQAVRLDPKFTLAFCASATAHAELYTFADRTAERRTLADAALNSALRLQPDLPEVHLASAFHLYAVYLDYERARVHLAIARRGLPNDSTAITLGAYMDRRQGNFERAIQEFNEAISRDPHNPESIAELGNTLFWMHQFRASEQAYDRLIELVPTQPMLKVQKAAIVRAKSGEATPLGLALAGLPTSMADDTGALCWRLRSALESRDWRRAKGLIQKMKGAEDDGNFVSGNLPVPVECYSILLARLQEQRPGAKASFVQTREQLNQKLQKSPGDANLLSQLAVVDALLGRKEAAIWAAKRAVEILPIFRDAIDGPGLLTNLAVVYAWSGEPDKAFETIAPLTKAPKGISYGDLKLSVWWDPLRKDPRFDKLSVELAPRD